MCSLLLKKYEIKYLEQLETMTDSELLKLQNFGQQTLEEINELLENRTKYFNEDNINIKNDNSLGEQTLKLLNSNLPLHIFSNRARNICEGNGILKFGHLARLTRSKVKNLKS